MLNGDGLRVVLWLSGCSHNCYKCQNPQTHDHNSGILFDEKAEEELFRELSKDYISGLTLTGGDPLHENNLDGVLKIVNKIRLSLPQKNIWLYSGYEYQHIFRGTPSCLSKEGYNNYKRRKIIEAVDVFVDGRYIDSQRDVSLRWKGSKNQHVIDVKKSLEQNKMVLYCD